MREVTIGTRLKGHRIKTGDRKMSIPVDKVTKITNRSRENMKQEKKRPSLSLVKLQKIKSNAKLIVAQRL